jgi:hypothetical protein
MNIANELRKLADQIEGTSLNTVEEKNIKKELYEEFLLRLKLIEDHLQRKRSQTHNLDLTYTRKFIDDYKLKIIELK